MPPDRHLSEQPVNPSTSGGSASAEHSAVAIDAGRHVGSAPVLAKPGRAAREIVAGLCLAPVLFIAGSSGLAIALGFSPLDVVTLFSPNAEHKTSAVATVPPLRAPSPSDSPAVLAMPDFSIVDQMLATEASRNIAKAPPEQSNVAARPDQPTDSPQTLPISHAEDRTMPSPALPAERHDAGAVATKTTPVTAAEPQPAESDSLPTPYPAEPQIRRLSSEEIDLLRSRAERSIEHGDISAARLLLERAAEAQDAGSILLLAQTYDPSHLGRWGIRGIRPDPGRAQQLYERAKQFGSKEAEAFANDLMRSGG